jgi:hypothetical protein
MVETSELPFKTLTFQSDGAEVENVVVSLSPPEFFKVTGKVIWSLGLATWLRIEAVRFNAGDNVRVPRCCPNVFTIMLWTSLA